MRRGIYRIKGVDDRPDDVRVDDDGITLPMAEAIYRACGHAPPLEALPCTTNTLHGRTHRNADE
jgi:hypothetical protein